MIENVIFEFNERKIIETILRIIYTVFILNSIFSNSNQIFFISN